MSLLRFGMALLTCALVIAQAGCVVPQPRGNGKMARRVEPETKSGYWLYLPEDYVARNGQRADGQRWPLVVTFHGMKPWDNARPQAREWQQEADRYGFIVVAPELRSSDSFMQYPLRNPDLSYVRRDERATLAIMDEVFRQTNADPNRVLATSWSSGGYMAHFMVNRYPERFSCLAVRQSNFSERLLDSAQVPKYRDMKIGIFFGENDFKICREENKRAVEWYRQHRFQVEAKYVGGLGHERTPQTAAAFFAATAGATPKTPPDLARMVMYDVYPVAGRSPGRRAAERRPPSGPGVAPEAGAGSQPMLFDQPERVSGPSPPTRVAPSTPATRSPTPVRIPQAQAETPPRPIRQPYRVEDDRGLEEFGPVPEILPGEGSVYDEHGPQPPRLHIDGGATGPAPLWFVARLELPEEWLNGVSILWTANSEPFGSDSFTARSVLQQPGEHSIEAHVVTADDRRFTLRQTLHVFQPASQPSE